MSKKLAIVGGGAAGLACAISAGERARQLGMPLEITIHESDERLGRSILATGNGRCNFSNARINTHEYRNAAFVESAFEALAFRFGPDSVHEFFASIGLAWREESDGRQYPFANKASVVVDVLRAAAAEYGVREACGSRIAAVEAPRAEGKPFTLRQDDGVFHRADAVVMACGGRAISAIDQRIVGCIGTQPVLGPLKVIPEQAAFTRELDNIRVKCTATLARKEGSIYTRVVSEAGELMFRKYGISGICVFNLSRFAEPGDIVRIDFLQLGGGQAAEDMLVERRTRLAARFGDRVTYEMLLRGLLLPRVSEAILKSVEIDADSAFSAFDAAHLARILSAFPLEVADIADPDISQVRRGGLLVEDFDPATMGAWGVPGFYAVGEALDVDGPCGGYNLHWAWASGLLAGASAVDELGKTN